MHVVKSRWLALTAICLALTFISGCQINGSTGSTGDLTHVRVKPDLNLHAAPVGSIYELWAMGFDVNVDEDSNFTPRLTGPYSVARFKWDPYLYAASDANDEFLPLTLESGMPLVDSFPVDSVFASQTPIAFITIEPAGESGDQLRAPSGPILLAFYLNAQSHLGVLISPFVILESGGRPAASYSLLSQSDKTSVPGARWRDNETEGQGIWFVNPRLGDKTVVDTIDVWDTYVQTFVPDTADPYKYVVWIHQVYPESSFSNFGLVMPDREPDFEFRDGRTDHAPGKYGPSDLIPGQPPIEGVQLGSDPVVIEGQTVGYRYITKDGGNPPRIDTCIVRVDNPALTRCNRDSILDPNDPRDFKFDSLEFEETSELLTSYRTTGGDSTRMGSSLAGVIDLSDLEALNRATLGSAFLFIGWEYEAWLVFTKESGIAPMSLGRFKSPNARDSKDPYTIAGTYDRNFHFPGEDFLVNLSQHDPSLTGPLNVVNDLKPEKLWITIEPDDDFGFDPAPDDPNTQLIYLSAFLPNDLDTNTARAAYFPMIYRDINPGPSSLNEGNFFPTVKVEFLPDPVE